MHRGLFLPEMVRRAAQEPKARSWFATGVVTSALCCLLAAGCTNLSMAGGDRSAIVSRTHIESCPLGVPETRIRLAETTDGIDVFLATSNHNLADLRSRARDQVRVNGPNRHQGPGHLGEHHGPRNHGLRLWSLGAVKATVEDTTDGVKLAIAAVDPAQQAEVRERVTQRVAQLEKLKCN